MFRSWANFFRIAVWAMDEKSYYLCNQDNQVLFCLLNANWPFVWPIEIVFGSWLSPNLRPKEKLSQSLYKTNQPTITVHFTYIIPYLLRMLSVEAENPPKDTYVFKSALIVYSWLISMCLMGFYCDQ